MSHRTLIIPDIHNKYKIAEGIIARERPDLTVFLGDYFDDIGDSPEDAASTARWLADSLDNFVASVNDDGTGVSDGRIHLIGNHDLHYMSENWRLRCSGFDWAKKDVIDACGIKWDRLRMYCWLGCDGNSGDDSGSTHDAGWLCTHAGFSNVLFEQQRKTTAETASGVLARASQDLYHVHDTEAPLVFLEAGRRRGGPNDVGGLVWCDYAEFEDIPHIRQIFGHTRGAHVRHGASDSICAEHYCIDTSLCNYIICEDYKTIRVRDT